MSDDESDDPDNEDRASSILHWQFSNGGIQWC